MIVARHNAHILGHYVALRERGLRPKLDTRAFETLQKSFKGDAKTPLGSGIDQDDDRALTLVQRLSKLGVETLGDLEQFLQQPPNCQTQLLTVHGAKGREADWVVFDDRRDDQVDSQLDANLIYVACTRAKKRLTHLVTKEIAN